MALILFMKIEISALYKVLQAGLVQQLDQVAAMARLILVR
jgi:uncharacterized protein YqgQ